MKGHQTIPRVENSETLRRCKKRGYTEFPGQRPREVVGSLVDPGNTEEALLYATEFLGNRAQQRRARENVENTVFTHPPSTAKQWKLR
ncbi:hypothetical protein CSUI_009577 [Cystoisospora suis]|uniref:Uncharacterized protein n=1 Tax=Cystoisospora suis TaxID=483139 RepID=A0A2C6K2S5_9APIC|nr:hypothetical protein CSUI_009577 [Cystoisospora suis]